jgi:MFS family permease
MINRNFLLLLSGQLVSQVGDKFHMIALSFYVLKTTGSSARMGAVLAASLIPSLVLGFFSGAFIDRYDRKAIIVGTDLIRGVIIGIFALLFYFEAMNFYVVLLMQVLLSVNAAFFDPTVPAIIPRIVDEKNLAAANSRHQFVNGFSTIAGAFLGGIMVSAFGYFWVFVMNAVSFIVSAGFECFIRIPSVHGEAEKKKQQGLWEDMRQGYRYILSRQTLVVLLFMVLVIHFFVGSIEVILPVMADTVSSDGVRALGFFQTALGLGTLIMAVFLSIRTISGREKASLFISVFIMGLIFLGTGKMGAGESLKAGFYLFMIFLFGCCIICAGISFRTLLQKGVDNAFAGRVFAVAGSIGNAAIPGAMIIYGVLLEHYSFQGLLMVSGLVLMLLSMVSFVLYKEKKFDRTEKVLSKPGTEC